MVISMRKRILMFLIAALFVLSSCGKPNSSLSSNSMDSAESSSDIASTLASSDTVTEAVSSETSSAAVSSQAPKSSSSSKTSSAPAKNNSTVAAPTVAEEKNDPVPAPTPEPPTTPVAPIQTSHTPIAKSSYYGYTLLNAEEKVLYDRFNAAALEMTNTIDLAKYNYSLNTVQKVLAYFIADFPQYFWVYKYEFSYVLQNNKLTQLILFYTDGETIDSYDEKKVDQDNNGWTLASREKIAEQRNTFNQQISAVLKTIPASGSAFEKEKKIHDYVVSHVTYDDALLEKLNQNPSDPKWLCHSSFTAYGALIQGTAVCEGYSKLFQYLCYETGIPCIPVIGTSNQQNHMWNAAKIDGDWYHVDTTWDNTSCQSIKGLLFYHYFNLNDSQIAEDHTIGIVEESDSTYPPPTCNATKYNYRENYYIQMDAEGKLSENAQQLLTACVSEKEQYLTIRLNGDFSEISAKELSAKLNNAKNELNLMLVQTGSKATLVQIRIVDDKQYSFISIVYK